MLRAHEEGHARVCKEAFEKMAEALARKTYRAFPSHFSWRSAPDCSFVLSVSKGLGCGASMVRRGSPRTVLVTPITDRND